MDWLPEFQNEETPPGRAAFFVSGGAGNRTPVRD